MQLLPNFPFQIKNQEEAMLKKHLMLSLNKIKLSHF